MFSLIKNEWDVQRSLAVALMSALALSGCGRVTENTESGNADNIATSASETVAEQPSFADGMYFTDDGKFSKNTCSGDAVCVSQDQYELLCSKVSGITQGLSNSLIGEGGINDLLTDEAAKLLEGGTIESIDPSFGFDRAEPLEKDPKVCSLNITVSGIYEGASSRKIIKAYIDGFVVKSGNVSAHSGSVFYYNAF